MELTEKRESHLSLPSMPIGSLCFPSAGHQSPNRRRQKCFLPDIEIHRHLLDILYRKKQIWKLVRIQTALTAEFGPENASQD